jgi:hypothetical protein
MGAPLKVCFLFFLQICYPRYTTFCFLQTSSHDTRQNPSNVEDHSGLEHSVDNNASTILRSTTSLAGWGNINDESYISPLRFYPLLVSESDGTSLAGSASSLETASFIGSSLSVETLPSSRLLTPDLKQLRLATISKSLDPLKRVCKYEVPGGGVCRDEGCEDVHLSRLVADQEAEPTGT